MAHSHPDGHSVGIGGAFGVRQEPETFHTFEERFPRLDAFQIGQQIVKASVRCLPQDDNTRPAPRRTSHSPSKPQRSPTEGPPAPPVSWNSRPTTPNREQPHTPATSAC